MAFRQQVAPVVVASLLMLAGCGFITGSDALTFSASPATASDAALSETGYEETNVTERTVSREFTAAGQTREVAVTNQLAQYERRVDLGPLGSQRAAVFVAFASPEVEVGPETFNPIADMSEREILQRFESAYEGISVGQQVGSRSVTALGGSATLTKFEGTATLGGSEVDVYVHAAKLQHEGDFVVAVGIYPQELDGEEAKVVTLVEGLEHAGG